MNTTRRLPQHPAPSRGEHTQPPHFLVGRNSRGQWVVRDRHARCGGLFGSRAEALRFAFRERGEAAGAVVLVPDVLELSEAPVEAVTAPIGSSNEPRTIAERALLEV